MCAPKDLVRLHSPNGDYVEFGVAGYEFPQNTEDRWDSNWLMIGGTASLGGRQWQFCEPGMTTFELQELAEWFSALSEGSADKNVIGFTEPNFEFEYLTDDKMRVFFELEVRPEWLKSNIAGQADVFVDVDASHAELRDASSTIVKMLIAFSERGRN
ncbi:MAG: hypothetical protein DHS20C05_25590 [Hyphococcus sp.]|nr:MAG: hypothetical protein DHS20C05_25590 [Marinicaulis sp.]